MPRNSIPNYFSSWSYLWNNWHDWLVDKDIPAIHACMNYALSFKNVNKIVVGVDSLLQLKQILKVIGELTHYDFPNIHSNDEMLINPSLWKLK